VKRVALRGLSQVLCSPTREVSKLLSFFLKPPFCWGYIQYLLYFEYLLNLPLAPIQSAFTGKAVKFDFHRVARLTR
jgi:hypothetical protein